MDFSKIRPYGDRLDDGRMQLSFTLPVPAGDQAREAARLYLEKMGLRNVQVVWMEPMGEGFAFFVAYGHATQTLNFETIRIPKPEFAILPFDDLVKLARERIRRKIVVIGATTGTDAHTVGIDAILSVKGVAGDRGLEYYPIFRVVNLRAQVSNEDLVRHAAEHKADAILVSQLVTQQNRHLQNLKELVPLIRQEKRLASHLLKIVGGPRMDHRTARSVGFDAGFGPGTKPSEVANYIVHELVRRIGEVKSRLEGEGPSETPPKRRSLFGWLSGRG
jgi:beta-lysine 5,6-aminomutase beta subunit